MERIDVAVGVILDSRQQSVLLAKRGAEVHQGGLWEFPGGKREPGEIIRGALRRELREELAIEVTDCEPLLRVEHDYTDKHVALDVWLVHRFVGEPHPVEGQELRWVVISDLDRLEFPAANRAIVTELKSRFPSVPF